jgi:hypothetical protein
MFELCAAFVTINRITADVSRLHQLDVSHSGQVRLPSGLFVAIIVKFHISAADDNNLCSHISCRARPPFWAGDLQTAPKL